MESTKVGKNLSISQSPVDWNIGPNYTIVRILGSGTYGTVCKAINTTTNQPVAIKRIAKLFDSVHESKRIFREICLLKRMNHANIIKLYDLIIEGEYENFDTIYILMEYCHSDLKKLIRSPIFLTELHVQNIIYNIFVALKYLKSANVLHRDLKPANILINDDCSIKLCDFGLARSVSQVENIDSRILSNDSPRENNGGIRKQKRKLTRHVVSRWYRAPEVILIEKSYSNQIDVWSAGCIAAELQEMIKENNDNYMTRGPLFPGSSCFPLSPPKESDEKEKNQNQISKGKKDQLSIIFHTLGTPLTDELLFVSDPNALKYIKTFPPKKRQNFKDLYPKTSEEGLTLLDKILKFNPNQRMDIEEILKSPYFDEVRDLKLEKIVEKNPIVLPFDEEEELTAQKIREYFIQEIKSIKKE